MRARRASIVLSAVLHAALVATLALLTPPGSSPEESPTTLVRLRLPPPDPPSRTATSPARESLAAPASALADPVAPPRQAQAPADTARPADPTASRQQDRSSVPSGSAPASTAGGASIGAFAGDRMPGAPAPRASAAPAARLAAPPPALYQGEGTRRDTPEEDSQDAAPVGVAAPVVRPGPDELLREMRDARSDAERVAEGTVEPEVSAGGRKLARQPGMPFPATLLAEGREAEVAIRIRIRPDGSVVPGDIVRSSGDPSVDSAVERVVRGYLFSASAGVTMMKEP